jgi:hypothetical protein
MEVFMVWYLVKQRDNFSAVALFYSSYSAVLVTIYLLAVPIGYSSPCIT